MQDFYDLVNSVPYFIVAAGTSLFFLELLIDWIKNVVTAV